ncbi:uncharacterized protein LOC143183335 [Calliopsis andreniformis]|uniref:uncharacterized protein LOC143183335 n=1 Tax=Calliopsis andreniformis TaxID=337506 RepID=UPI003FCE8DCB
MKYEHSYKCSCYLLVLPLTNQLWLILNVEPKYQLINFPMMQNNKLYARLANSYQRIALKSLVSAVSDPICKTIVSQCTKGAINSPATVKAKYRDSVTEWKEKQNHLFESEYIVNQNMKRIMKTLLLLFVLYFSVSLCMGVFRPDQLERLNVYKIECMNETGIDSEKLQNVTVDQIVEDEELNCFMACIFKKFSIMNEDGSLNEEIAYEHTTEEGETEAIDKCKNTTGEDVCEKAGNLMKCFILNKATKAQ